jgi:ubiquinone/menaquinone biosynthesis C-methylase UbiE
MGDTEEYYSRVAEKYAEEQSFEEMPDDAEKSLKKLLNKFMKRVESGAILDAGCGPGRDTEYFASNGFRAAGIDSAPGMIEKATERNNQRAKYAVMDITDIGFDDATFDGVWCNTVMQFIPRNQMKKAVSELHRVLKPGGKMYITFKLGTGEHVRDSDGLTRYLVPKKEVLKLLKRMGFRIEDYSTFQLNELTAIGVHCTRED